MDTRTTNLDFSFQQMPYAHENPTNAFCNEGDKLERSDLKLFEPSTQPTLKEARNGNRVQFQFDPPMHSSAQEENYCRDPVLLEALKERSKKMTDAGWKFDATSLSEPASGLRSSLEHQLTQHESAWIGQLKLSKVMDEKRAKQAAIDQGKQSLPWEVNDINTEEYALFDKEGLEKELDAFYGFTDMDSSNTFEGPMDVDNMAATSTDWPTLLASQTINPSQIEKIPYASFADSAISVNDPFAAEFMKISSSGCDSFYDEFSSSPPVVPMEDYLGPEFSTAPSATSPFPDLASTELNPTFPVEEGGETDHELLRMLNCNNGGLDESFLDAPFDLEGFATDFNPPVNNEPKNSHGSSCYDPFGSSTLDVDRSYNDKMQSAFAFPDTFLDYNIPPTDKAVAQPQQNVPTPPGASCSVNPVASTVSQQSLDISKQDATSSPDRSAAAQRQLLSCLQTNANSTVGKSSPTSVQSVGTRSESSSDIIASSTPARVHPYQPMGSKTRTSSRSASILPEHDSSDTEAGDNGKRVKVLPSNWTPSKRCKPNNRASPGRMRVNYGIVASDVDEISHDDYKLHHSIDPALRELPSTPTRRPRQMAHRVTQANSDMSSPMSGRSKTNLGPYFSTPTKRPASAGYDMGDPQSNGSEIDLGRYFYGRQTIASSPDLSEPSTPTAPVMASFPVSTPYHTSYHYKQSPTRGGRSSTTILHGQILGTPQTPPRSPEVVRMARMRTRNEIIRKEKKAAKVAADAAKKSAEAAQEAAADAARQAAWAAARLSRINEQHPQKRVRRAHF
ncbi:hypothetical protein MMC07_008447 [Pseudocyphellaria aurata]|nr:hypothetical protein [Pseudocyphellaria aurata]